jgi:hypothetical protein
MGVLRSSPGARCIKLLALINVQKEGWWLGLIQFLVAAAGLIEQICKIDLLAVIERNFIHSLRRLMRAGSPASSSSPSRPAEADQKFFVPPMQSNEACKNKEPVCAGGKYDPTISPSFAESLPHYHAVRSRASTGAMVRRSSGPPEFGSGPGQLSPHPADAGSVSIFYDVNQGAWQTQHRHQRAFLACQPVSVKVRRPPRPLGGRNTRGRRD